MVALLDVKKLALGLSERDRARLAEHLLRSLPGAAQDDDGGLAVARERAAELEADPSLAISLEELDASLRRRQG